MVSESARSPLWTADESVAILFVAVHCSLFNSYAFTSNRMFYKTIIYFAMRTEYKIGTILYLSYLSYFENIYKLFLSLHNDMLLILFGFSPELICLLNEMYSVPRTLQCDCV